MKPAQTLQQTIFCWIKLVIRLVVPVILLFILLWVMPPQQKSQAASPDAFPCPSVSDIPVTECDALVELYNSTNGASWTVGSNTWLVTLTPCTTPWYGITCSGGHVTRIDLPQNQLSGVIPTQLGNLPQLQNLALNNNQLTGNIPHELGNLTQLQNLFLYNNQLSGNIPHELGNLTQLKNLSLNNNQLSGVIPPQLGNLTQLQTLYLSTNPLTSTIPAELGNLTNLQNLYLSTNQLSGTIPVELGNLTKLQNLYLYNNQLTGNIPHELGNLTELTGLELNSNMLNGSIPSSLGNLKHLYLLYLNTNQLAGSIPPELGNLTSLQHLYLQDNQLTGSIPPDLGNLANLITLILLHNQLTGSIPPELGKLSNLSGLNLGVNGLIGPIPRTLGNLSNLGDLFLNHNQLSDSIPPELGNLTKLDKLWLQENKLTGSIPSELGNLTNLHQFYLLNNQLSGEIPASLGNLVNAHTFLLSYNALTGEVPSSIVNVGKNWVATHGGHVGDLQHNMLSASNSTVRDFLISNNPQFFNTQTVPPMNLQVRTTTATSITLGWAPITYTVNSGGYEIGYATQPSGPYVVHNITSSKVAITATVDGLCPNQTYYFAVRTYTPHHNQQQNNLHSDFGQPIQVTTLADTASLKLLGIYLLALDNNLSEERDPILQEIQAATADLSSCSKAALVLADQKGDHNTKAFFIQGSKTITITDLPINETNQITDEYNMADGAQLGAFIKWGRQQYHAAQTILSFVGHGLPLAPSTDVSLLITTPTSIAAAIDDNIFPLPIRPRIYAHADQLTDAQSKSLISPHALAEALDIGTDKGQNPLTVLDIVHCFGGTIEEFYEVSHYAQALIGSPNYTYSSGLMLGRALLAVQPGQSARYMAEAMIDAYDRTLAEADQSDEQPATVDHPRVLVALESDRLAAIKTSVDQLANALAQTLVNVPDTIKTETRNKIIAAQQNSQKYDTTLCSKPDMPQDWVLNQDDALSDLGDFATQLSQQFILSPTVAITATNVLTQVKAAVIKTIKVSGTPWFAKDPNIQWKFGDNISGIGLYTDFHGTILHDDQFTSLGWQAHWYNKGGQDYSDNPHPLAFIQGATTWSDVLADFWRGQSNGVQTVICTVEFPTVRPLFVYLPIVEH